MTVTVGMCIVLAVFGAVAYYFVDQMKEARSSRGGDEDVRERQAFVELP